MNTEPTIKRVDLQEIANEACETLRQVLDVEGLTLEAATLLPQFERSIRSTIAAVESGAPEDFSPDFALAYLTGRIAKEQVRAIEAARAQVRAAAERATNHWSHAIEAERRRLSGDAGGARPQPAPEIAQTTTAPEAAPITLPIRPMLEAATPPRATAPQPSPLTKLG